ncbi:MAG: putative glutamyl-tRNA synthetase [Acidimicrobiales bacterium]|nr:putative glutamyl-tRNA synthetase [Acidimicrobiales bacterium]
MAPSPTGFFHVGSVRTTLYNWLYARQQGGTFVLRIEDTDAERNREEWVDMIYDALRWLGLDWDELYRQSERAELYAAAAAKLEADGRAYWCDCTREDVEARAKERGGPPGYDGFCRDRGLGSGEGRALRFRTPDEGTTVVHDVVRGDPAFENSTIEDFVLVRSNGAAIFLLANVVDDGDMSITHVIRGDDHLPNTPKYLLLWDALGYGEHPVFAHLPMIVNEKRQKLSKRRDPVALEQYRDEGYLAEVILNYLALVGWSPPDGRERMTVEEMVEVFRLEDIGKSAGFFDVAKLRAFNGDAIRELPLDEFIERALPFVRREVWGAEADVDTFRRLAPLVQERVAVLGEVPAMVDFIFLDEAPDDEASWAKAMKEGAADILDATAAAYADAEWQADVLKEALLAVGEGLGLKLSKTQAPVRVAVTGRTVGPPLFESLEVLGREKTLARLAAARSRL